MVSEWSFAIFLVLMLGMTLDIWYKAFCMNNGSPSYVLWPLGQIKAPQKPNGLD